MTQCVILLHPPLTINNSPWLCPCGGRGHKRLYGHSTHHKHKVHSHLWLGSRARLTHWRLVLVPRSSLKRGSTVQLLFLDLCLYNRCALKKREEKKPEPHYSIYFFVLLPWYNKEISMVQGLQYIEVPLYHYYFYYYYYYYYYYYILTCTFTTGVHPRRERRRRNQSQIIPCTGTRPFKRNTPARSNYD